MNIKSRFCRIALIDYPEIIEWFKKEDFYFLTKRPNSLSESSINELLEQNVFVLNDSHGEKRGIAKIEMKKYYVAKIIIRFFEKEMYSLKEGEDILKEIIEYLCFNRYTLNRIQTEIFGFDHKKIFEFYEKSGFKREAVLRNHIYYLSKWHDLYIYGLLKEEFKEGDKIDASTELEKNCEK